MPRLPASPAIRLCLVAALALLAYLPGLDGPLLLDDRDNLPHAGALAEGWQGWWETAVGGEAGPLRRPLARLGLALERAAGLEVRGHRTMNLLLHLLTGLLLYRVTLALCRTLALPAAQSTALLAAGLWLLHPQNVSTVLYLVQRMAQLSALFVLAGVLCYLEGRRRLAGGRRGGWWWLLAAFLPLPALAALGKENGALLPLLLLVVESLALRWRGLSGRARCALQGLFLIFLAVPAAAVTLTLWLAPQHLLGGYALRDFTLDERLLSQPRALWLYLSQFLLPLPGPMTLFHDDFAVSRGPFTPATTLPAALALAAVALLCWRWRRRRPLLALGVFWFLAGHALESTILPLEMVFEHRNYLPMAGLTWPLAALLANALPPRRLAVTATALLLGLALASGHRAWLMADPARLVRHDLRWHPDSLRLQGMLADLHWRQYRRSGDRRHLEAAAAAWERIARNDRRATGELVALLTLHDPEREPRYPAWRRRLLARLAAGIGLEQMKTLKALVQCRPACPA